MAQYTPFILSSRAVTAADHDAENSFPLITGVTTLYRPGNDLRLRFPDSPADLDWVAIKNAAYDLSVVDDRVTIVPTNVAGEDVEMPGQDSDIQTGDQFTIGGRYVGWRWIFVSGIGWVLDMDHKPTGQKVSQVAVAGPYVAAENDIILADTDSATGDITVLLPEELPNNSLVTVKKDDLDIYNHDVIIQPQPQPTPTRLIEGPYIGVTESDAALVTGLAAGTWVATSNKWRLISQAQSSYIETYFLPVPLVMPGAGGTTVQIVLDTAIQPHGRMFSISNGVLTALWDMAVRVSVNAAIELWISANNQAVESAVYPVTSAALTRLTGVAASASHARSVILRETRSSSGVIVLSQGDTLSYTAEELYADGSSTATLQSFFLQFEPF